MQGNLRGGSNKPWAGLLFQVGEGRLLSHGVPIITPSPRDQKPLKSGLACWVLTAGVVKQEKARGLFWPQRAQSQAGIIHVCHCFVCYIYKKISLPIQIWHKHNKEVISAFGEMCEILRRFQSPSVLHGPSTWGVTVPQPDRTWLASSRRRNLVLPCLRTARICPQGSMLPATSRFCFQWTLRWAKSMWQKKWGQFMGAQ